MSHGVVPRVVPFSRPYRPLFPALPHSFTRTKEYLPIATASIPHDGSNQDPKTSTAGWYHSHAALDNVSASSKFLPSSQHIHPRMLIPPPNSSLAYCESHTAFSAVLEDSISARNHISFSFSEVCGGGGELYTDRGDRERERVTA